MNCHKMFPINQKVLETFAPFSPLVFFYNFIWVDKNICYFVLLVFDGVRQLYFWIVLKIQDFQKMVTEMINLCQ